MKLLLSGPTGFIGHEILLQALAHPHISSIVALSRKALPAFVMADPKVKVILMEDFGSYSAEVLGQLDGVEGCIWTIGAKSTNADITRKVTMQYSLTALQAFSQLAMPEGKRFKFVFVSGVLAVRNQKEHVWLYPDSRKVAGETETKLLEYADEHKGVDVFIARPSAVLAKNGGVKSSLMGLAPSIRVDVLAAALLKMALEGNDKSTVNNGELVKFGKEALGSLH